MSWERQILSPPTPKPLGELRAISMGLVKSCGSVGFLVGGLGTMRIGQSVLHLPADFWFASNWHGATAGLFLFSFLAAFVMATHSPLTIRW